MSCAAIIASRGPTQAKSRLASFLSGQVRMRLVETMLDMAVAAARDAIGYSEVILVSPTQHDVPENVTLLVDGDEGLNAAFTLACKYAVAHGHHSAALIPADLPGLSAVDLEELLTMAAATGVAIAGDLKNEGTNAFLIPLPLPIELAYEGQSFFKHVIRCQEAGLNPAIVRRQGFAFDVDEACDLAVLRKTAQFAFLFQTEAIYK